MGDRMKIRFTLSIVSILLVIVLGCTKVNMDSTGLVKLGEGVYALVAESESFADNLGTNRGFVIGSEAVLVIDPGYTPEHAGALLARVRELTDLPVKYAVNTHYHPVNVWGNSVFREQGAVIIARPETASYMEETFPGYMEYYRSSKPARYEQIKDVQLTLPDSLMTGERQVVDLGGRRVILQHFGPAHTAGDCLVSIPECGVLFPGGIISNGYHPNMADPGADFDNWIEILDRLSGAEISYVVPGEGRLCGRKQIGREKAYIRNLTEACADSIRKGVPLRRMISTLNPGAIIPEAENYGHRNIFSYNINKVFLNLLPEIVQPDFRLDLPEGFTLGGGGGGESVGRMHWFRSLQIYEEVEVQWQPTSRETILSQDVYTRGARFKTSSGDRKMSITGDKKIDLGGEKVTAVHGRWADSITSVGATGFWTLTTTIRDGRLYTFNCLVRVGKDDDAARERLIQLEKVLSTFRLAGE
ncbi:MAG: MBL fold metallo-hydrolase [Candidatus Latescibacteria bacterium]|nr:MBL fold metallo-hydrolase [bacterium]MBD3423727.1 MBL fold metallo-hydrolase [Candidatus Latescibacterota bacterium]